MPTRARASAVTPAAPYAQASTAPLVHRSLPLLLLPARERVIANFRRFVNAHGLTEQQWRILRVLLDVDALKLRQIVQCCGISSPSLAGVLARMAQLGLVQRAPVAGDARRVRASLTATAGPWQRRWRRRSRPPTPPSRPGWAPRASAGGMPRWTG